MATLHVRNVPEPLYETLRQRAESEGRSIAAQALYLIEDALLNPAKRRREAGLLKRSQGPTASAFDRFTPRARNVVTHAEKEAEALKHDAVGTEHILLGLLRERHGLAVRVLESLGIAAKDVRAQVKRSVGQGETSRSGPRPFTPESKKALELSLREALALGHNYIGTEHILLGLIREKKGVAARVLGEFGADADKTRDAFIRLVSAAPWAEPTFMAGAGRGQIEGPPTEWEYRATELKGPATKWTEDLNAAAGEGWELLSLLQQGAGARAVFRRPVG